jgi:hypothetical protein
VQVSRGVFDFSLPFDREMNNVFGLRSGYTCCTSNMHQGWTKFATHLWFRTPTGGVAALAYAPSLLKTTLPDGEVTIKEVTNYPFEETISFEFGMAKRMRFPFQLRIPGWCAEATVNINGEAYQTYKGGQVVEIVRDWSNNDRVVLLLPMKVTTSNWGGNSRAIERGPLVYALRLEERWEKGSEPKEGDYYSVYPTQPWNYGLLKDVIDNPAALKVSVKPLPEKFVWNLASAPIEITATARKIPSWKVVDGVARQPVTDRTGLYKGEVGDKVETIRLIPYGCTKVRIVAFPVVK